MKIPRELQHLAPGTPVHVYSTESEMEGPGTLCYQLGTVVNVECYHGEGDTEPTWHVHVAVGTENVVHEGSNALCAVKDQAELTRDLHWMGPEQPHHFFESEYGGYYAENVLISADAQQWYVAKEGV